jgi:hypothetical protein
VNGQVAEVIGVSVPFRQMSSHCPFSQSRFPDLPFNRSSNRCRSRTNRRRSGPTPSGGTEEKPEKIRGVSPIPLTPPGSWPASPHSGRNRGVAPGSPVISSSVMPGFGARRRLPSRSDLLSAETAALVHHERLVKRVERASRGTGSVVRTREQTPDTR